MLTHVFDIVYTIKNLILKLKSSMKKGGKAVDCVFLQKFIEFFCGIM